MPSQPPPQSQPPLALPPTLSPDTLDALTELAAIVSRLQPPQPTLPGGISVGTPGAATTPAAGMGVGGPSNSTISIKDVPNATDSVKHKLQRARAQIKALPDMARTMEEQEATIAELEETIRRQQEVLASLRNLESEQALDAADRDKMEM